MRPRVQIQAATWAASQAARQQFADLPAQYDLSLGPCCRIIVHAWNGKRLYDGPLQPDAVAAAVRRGTRTPPGSASPP